MLRQPRSQSAWKITHLLPHTINPRYRFQVSYYTLPRHPLPKITTMSGTDGQDPNKNTGPSDGSAPAVASLSQAEMAQVSEQAAWLEDASTRELPKMNYNIYLSPHFPKERG